MVSVDRSSSVMESLCEWESKRAWVASMGRNYFGWEHSVILIRFQVKHQT